MTTEILRPYQIDDLAKLIGNKRHLLLGDPGTGKTPPACVYTYWVCSELKKRVIWLQPKQIMVKNRDEILRFSEFKPEDVVIVDGTKKQIDTALASDAKVFIMGGDRFRLLWTEIIERYKDVGAVVVDELHMLFGSNSSQRTKAFYRAMRFIPRFVGMTGTLINGRLSSAYPAIHVIEPRYYPSYATFLNIHAIQDEWGKVIYWKNHAQLKAILQRHAIRRSFEEVFGKEAKVIFHQYAQMSPAQLGAYKEFEKDAILELADSYLEGHLPGVHAIRCRQILSHPETFGLAVGEKTGKDELLEIHLNDHLNTGEPLPIYCALIPEQERIYRLVQSMEMKVALLNGNTPNNQRSKIDAAFRAGEIQVVVGSPQVAAIGYNWQHVNNIIFTSLDYMDSSFFQAYRRAMREKRTKPLSIYIMEYKDTIEERIFQIIQRKSREANLVDDTREVLDLRKTAV